MWEKRRQTNTRWANKCYIKVDNYKMQAVSITEGVMSLGTQQMTVPLSLPHRTPSQEKFTS